MPLHDPLDPRHVWRTSMNDLRVRVDEVIKDCMVYGEHGWPPRTGGVNTIANGKKLILASIKMLILDR